MTHRQDTMRQSLRHPCKRFHICSDMSPKIFPLTAIPFSYSLWMLNGAFFLFLTNLWWYVACHFYVPCQCFVACRVQYPSNGLIRYRFFPISVFLGITPSTVDFTPKILQRFSPNTAWLLIGLLAIRITKN